MADTLDDIERELDGQPTIRPKGSTPPPKPGMHWSPAGVVLVLSALSALCVTLGTVLGPLVNKPDLSGYVKLSDFEEHKRQQKKDTDELADTAARARRKASDAWQVCEDLRGQFSGLDDRQESLETKRRRTTK